jgi:molybdate transport system permease protein
MLVLALLAVPMLLFIVLPLMSLLLRAGSNTLAANSLSQGVVQAVLLSLMTTSLATLLAILLGTPLAYLLARYNFRGRTLIETLIDLPMVLPPAVAGVALLMAFGRRGVLGTHLSDIGLELAFTQAAVVLAQLFVAAPFYIKSAIAGFSRIERASEEAAALDGAGPWLIFRHITVPLAAPALFGGGVMTWARALGEFGATIIFAGNFPGRTQTMPLAIYIGFELDLGVALTLSLVLLVISFGVLVIVKGLLRQRVGAV